MVPPDSTSGSQTDLRPEGGGLLDASTRNLVLGRIRLGLGVLWAFEFAASSILFVFMVTDHAVSPAEILGMLGAVAAAGALSLLPLRQVDLLLQTKPLGPDLYGPLTRFPQASSLVFFYLGAVLGGILYLWTAFRPAQSAWVALAVLVLALVLAGLGAICHYFIAKQNLVRVYRLLARDPEFLSSQARFSTTLQIKFGFGMVAITLCLLLGSALESGLALQASTRARLRVTTEQELAFFGNSLAYLTAKGASSGEVEALLGSLKPAGGGRVCLQLPSARGGGRLGPEVETVHRGDILVSRRLPDGSELQTVIPQGAYLEDFWTALRPNIVLLLMAIAYLAFILRIVIADLQKPLLLLTLNAQRVGEGRIGQLEPVYADDEVAHLVEGFTRMAGSLRGMVIQIRSASRDLAKASAAIRESGDGVRQANLGQRELIEASHGRIRDLAATALEIDASSMELNLASRNTSATVGEMAASVQHINQSMDELLMVVEGIASALQDFDTAIQGVGKNVDRLGGHAEHTREFAENLEQSTSAIEDSIKIAQRCAKKVIQNAGRGMELVARNREKIQVIHGAVQEFHGTTKALLRAGGDIVKILDYIGDHAQQTNLLALNAAIIASQGGDGGDGQARGFAVVADEIKTLADQTGRSTQEIQQIVGALQSEIRKAYRQVGLVLDAVRDGSDSVAHSEEALHAILDSVGEMDSVVESVFSETLQQGGQASLIHEANRNIHHQVETIRSLIAEQQQTSNYILSLAMNVQRATAVVRDSTRDQSAGSEEIALAAEQVKMLAGRLHDILAHQKGHVLSLQESVEHIKENALGSEKAIEASSGSVQQLGAQVHMLNREVNLFKV